MNKIQIFAVSKDGAEEITDLYWFEEHGVHWFDGDNFRDLTYTFRIIVDGEIVWPRFEYSGEILRVKKE